MGYDLHITKAEHWVDVGEHPIQPLAWASLVESDAELTLSSEDFYERKAEGGGIERIYATLWCAQTCEATLWFQDGEIVTKNPEDTTIVKMLEIATKLGAQVQGDDGEVYRQRVSAPGWEIQSE